MISVIIPVYNTEEYVSRCIDSVLNSTYRNFELILVNDGSQDKSAEICKYYLKKDSRVQYYEQRKSGVSAARNKGIANCTGDWIVFIDSDDYISRDFLGIVAEKKYQEYDFLIFDYIRLKKKIKRTTEPSSVFPCTGADYYGAEKKKELTEKLLNAEQLAENGNTKLWTVWAKAYKKSLIQRYNIKFPTDITIGEDALFNLEYLQKIRSCIYIQKIIYFFEVRPNSATHGFNKDLLQNDMKYQERLKGILKRYSVFAQVKTAYYNSLLFHMADVLIKGIFNPYSTRTYEENYRLCQEMHQNELYMDALKYNKSTGRVLRRILLFFFRIEYYRIVNLICKISYKILEKTDRL